VQNKTPEQDPDLFESTFQSSGTFSSPRTSNSNGCPCYMSEEGTYFFISHGLINLPSSDRDFYVSYTSAIEIAENLEEDSDEEFLPGRSPAPSISRAEDMNIPALLSDQFGFEINRKHFESDQADEGVWQRLREYETDSPAYLKTSHHWKSDRDTKVFIWWPEAINDLVGPIVMNLTDDATDKIKSIFRSGEQCKGLHLPCMTASELNAIYELSVKALKQEDVVQIVWEFASIAWSIPTFRDILKG